MSPLDAPRIDLLVRVGWLLRMSRVVGGVGLREMAAGLTEFGVPTSAATVSRLETGWVRSGAVLDGYAHVLGEDQGRLRAAVDAMCRTFDYAPKDVSPYVRESSLGEFTGIVNAVRATAPQGGEWLRFAREHQDPRRFGLDAAQVRPLVDRLASELGRSVGTAFMTRYEALARLRNSAYAGLVFEVVRERVKVPEAQVVTNAVVAVSELPSHDALDWVVDLLVDPSPPKQQAAQWAIQNMGSVGGLTPEDWLKAVPGFVAAYRAVENSQSRLPLAHLYETLPLQVRTAIGAALGSPPLLMERPARASQMVRDSHWALCEEIAGAACREVGVPDQPMLARLIYELLYDLPGTRSGAAGLMLMASPFLDAVHPQLVYLSQHGVDSVTRAAAAVIVSLCQSPTPAPEVVAWLSDDREDLAATAYRLLGNAGASVSEGIVASDLRHPTRWRHVVAYLGLVDTEAVRLVAGDPGLPEEVRRAARWWENEGSRVVR